ncbi:MAG: 2-oxo-4-hydroxy-4-carboxy-5-ureidoimidazoline decarboxylase [Elusimicrobia bacterium]|nr:2-oxo-4-hydroxy-4-carboxy-5-ureidoimidazoline decarboxylase [Elusimicrobiota bacterium]
MESLNFFNQLTPEKAIEELLRCCGSIKWARQMSARRPYPKAGDVYRTADQIWGSLKKNDWLEAFRAHPKIGGTKALKAKFNSTRAWSNEEQAGVNAATPETLTALAGHNRSYERRFGHIFIVCATGKTADEMLELIKARLANKPQMEIKIAAQEQAKITRIRLEKLLNS